MATDLEVLPTTPAAEADSVLIADCGDSVVLHGIPWTLYRRLRRTPENYNIRMTYDGGELEIMSPSVEHEGIATLLGNLITVWALEFRIPFRSCRTMTIRRSLLERGFEPDNCYYVQHEPQMWNKKKVRFKTDPPPDLAIEVEVTRKLLNKMAIYAAFRVPELWSWRGDELKVYEFTPQGEYVARESSLCFPAFPIAKTQEIVRQLCAAHETDLILSFRDWVRENVKSPG
jgi:Uma2 family endonuclease